MKTRRYKDVNVFTVLCHRHQRRRLQHGGIVLSLDTCVKLLLLADESIDRAVVVIYAPLLSV